MAVKIVSKSILIHAAPAAVWEYIYIVSSWSKWMSGVSEVRLFEQPKRDALGAIFFSKRSRSRFLIHNVETRKTIQWSTERFWSELRHTLHLIEDAEGTVLTEEVESLGTFEKQTAFFYRGRITQETVNSLSHLKELAEPRPPSMTSSASRASEPLHA